MKDQAQMSTTVDTTPTTDKPGDEDRYWITWGLILETNLAYLPALQTKEECQVLDQEYDWRRPFRTRIPIKTIAGCPVYPNTDTLYRKLYKVRAWCKPYIGYAALPAGDAE